jgi:hypothetical protein
MNDVDFEKVRSLFKSDDKECLLVFCGEYFKQIHSMDARKLSWPKLGVKKNTCGSGFIS